MVVIDVQLTHTQDTKMYTKKFYTLIFIKNNSRILLGFKTRGLGVGLWNGFGGKIELQETIWQGARRELKEETNLEALDLRHVGVVVYYEENLKRKSVVHIFTSARVVGNPTASEEMNPIKWYGFESIPYNTMWPDCRLWYNLMLADNYFTAVINYNLEKIVKYDVTVHKDIQEVMLDIKEHL